MKRYIKRTLAGIAVLLAGVAFSGCVKDEGFNESCNKKDVTFHLRLDIPGLGLASRAMTDAQETAVDYGTLQVLVFEETPGGDVFRYKATITTTAPPMITLRVSASRASEKYRLVLVANMPDQTIADGTSKSDALSQYLFYTSGKWDASSADPAKIPMWGETVSFTITQDRSTSLLLHRALARVDVGTLFKFSNVDPDTGLEYENKETDKESVWGLDNFKISDVRVYRTRDQAYAASSADRMSGNEVIVPNIPASAQFNSNSGTSYPTPAAADADPLLYTLSTASASFLREIYIPESSAIDAQSNADNVPCLVIGGYYGTDVTPTYYRADFAVYSNGAVVSYFPVLRNHRYVFDIRSVSGSGSPTPEEALNSVNSKLDLNIVEWNEEPLNYYANKYYFLELESRTLTLAAQAQAGATTNTGAISYDTDLVLDGVLKSMTYTWAGGSLFSVNIDYANREFVFTALSDNVGAGTTTRSDVLTVTVEDLTFDIIVYQNAFNLLYDLDCGSVQVYGQYMEGVTLNYSHYITLNVTSATDLVGEQYEVKTTEKNGILFTAEGTFPSVTPTAGVYVYPLTLQGTGTLLNESGNPALESFDVTIVSNSINDASCTARIIVGYQTKKILTIGANAALVNGYMLEPNSASRAFVDATINFGPNPESTVKMTTNRYGNAFSIEVMTIGNGMVGEVINYDSLRSKLNWFQPDIILTGQAINYYTVGSGTNVIELLNSFVDAGGVFLMCNEYYPNIASVNAMVTRVMGSGSGSNQSIGTNQLFTLASGSQYEDDLILNGPFGDMRGRQWGADGHEMHGFTGLPAGTIIYSQRTNGAYNMFRHSTKGFFFMGEGGFISNPQRYIGGAYQGSYVYYPFAIDALYRPIPRTNFSINQQPVYNSQIFGNLLVWAIDYSEKNGIVYEPGVDRF